MENIEETFLKVLSPYISDSILRFQEQEKNYKFGFDIKNYNDSLHVVFQYNKTGKIGIKEVHIFQIFLAKVNIEASKSKLNYTTLLDTNALFFSKKLLPYLHSYEWALRKLIYLLAPAYFSDNWAEESIPNEIISSIKRKQIQAIGKFDSKNLLQWIDLYDFEEYLFGENYILVTQENEENIVRYKEISQDQLLKLFQDNSHTISGSYSLWSEVFSKYMDVKLEEIQTDMSLIREGRNIVSHNKEIEMALYQELIKKLKRYTNQLEKAFQKILAGDIAGEDLSDMSDDFEGYIGNYFSNIDLAGVAKLSESLSAMKVLNTDSMKRSMESIGQTLSVQQEIMQNFDTKGIRSVIEGINQSLQSMKIVNTDSMKRSIESIGQTLSVQQEIMQNFDTEGIRRVTEGINQSLQSMKIVNTDSMKRSIESIGQTLSALSAQRAIMQNFDIKGIRSATEGINQSLQSMKIVNTDSMKRSMESIGKISSTSQVLKSE
ncbi:MAG: hypothetical protein ACLUQ0_03485 [Enterococcus italicus]|uniref:hypothetical protein n=1 Tax=Enterococcus italicus TaxID=246144 RepID=UPI003990F5AB